MNLNHFIPPPTSPTLPLTLKVEENVLADLKHLLLEAKQKIPPFLASIVTEAEVSGNFFLAETRSY